MATAVMHAEVEQLRLEVESLQGRRDCLGEARQRLRMVLEQQCGLPIPPAVAFRMARYPRRRALENELTTLTHLWLDLWEDDQGMIGLDSELLGDVVEPIDRRLMCRWGR